MRPELYPLTFTPIYKPKVWGGTSLAQVFDRKLPTDNIGESWDVAAHPHGMSIVDRGKLAGKSLADLLLTYRAELVGSAGLNPEGKFPLLLKLIDAQDKLSVQVHPDNAYVMQHTAESWGKTEMWYIVACEPGAWIIWGLKQGVTKRDLESALKTGGEAILDCLNRVPVQPGELYPISAGLVHALGAGVMVAEIQQNSDSTYRLYDWDRPDRTGCLRELHLKDALAVIDFSDQALDRSYQLGRCLQHFRLNVLNRPAGEILVVGDRFQILTALGGRAEIMWRDAATVLQSGQSCLLPAALARCTLSAAGVVLQSTLP